MTQPQETTERLNTEPAKEHPLCLLPSELNQQLESIREAILTYAEKMGIPLSPPPR
ncbi:hypothetical protein [Anthocerotibacter panamensis]|uniref:hypothetical protein n=1 Tax=Anthocerotibacter panamensis TaxID=2857077 RepID=UPI001C404B38|nr:hypothetical protein [Anthocerotibacter panamensis]